MEMVDGSKGHLSAKLKIINDDNSVTWLPYDTRTETQDPVQGTIMVFDSRTGQYEECVTLQEAKNKFIEHYERLLTPSLLADGFVIANESDIKNVIGKKVKYSLSARQ